MAGKSSCSILALILVLVPTLAAQSGSSNAGDLKLGYVKDGIIGCGCALFPKMSDINQDRLVNSPNA
jgi:hypothetical protein